jgi:hypothetical protein
MSVKIPPDSVDNADDAADVRHGMTVLMVVTDKHIVTDDPGSRVVDVVWRNVRHVEYDNMRFDWEDIDYFRQGVYCAVYGGDGVRFSRARFPTASPDKGLEFPELNCADDAARTAANYYVYDLEWNMDVTTVWLRGMIDASRTYNSMSTIMTLAFTVLPAILVLGVLGGWLISKSTFKPMVYIMKKAESISDGDDLSARINLQKGPPEMRKLADTFDGMFGRLEASFESEKTVCVRRIP